MACLEYAKQSRAAEVRTTIKKGNRSVSGQLSWKLLLETAASFAESEFLDEMKASRRLTESKASITEIDASVLYALVRLTAPLVVIESGTYRGMSTAIVRRAQLDAGLDQGVIFTVDKYPERQLGLLIPPELKQGVIQIVGDVCCDATMQQLPTSCDFFFHDSSHRYYHQLWEYRTFWKRLSVGGVLASHDVNMTAAFASFVSASYVHDDAGYSTPESTHLSWGSISKVGFIQKR
jgi:predicted O-methyltransferase YrrM